MKKPIIVGDRVVTPLNNIVGEITKIKSSIAEIKITKRFGSPTNPVTSKIFKLHVDTLIKCDEK